LIAIKKQIHWLPFGAALLIIAGCSRQKDAFLNRTYHNMTSKYNVYFNGYEAFIKGKNQIEKGYQLDYDTLLPVYLWPTESSAPGIKADMDRAIEKGHKVIREHSMVIGNKQKNKMIDDTYLLIGMSRFYNRDFFPALETFQYTARQFPDSDNFFKAKIWVGRTHTQMNNFMGAAGTFEDLYKNRQVPKRLRPYIAASMAEMYIVDGQLLSAASKVEEARKTTKNKEEKLRWTFLHAQIEAALGNGYEASNLFLKASKMGGPYEMKFKAKLLRAINFDVYMDNPDKIYEELQKMLKDEKNTDAKDEIYYVMAEIALREEDFPKAEGFLEKSIRSSTVNQTQKGLSYLKFADINFEFKEYVKAKAYYDSASTSLGAEHKRHAYAEKRAKVLERLVQNLQIIELEDSLQRLAAMPEAQVRKIFEDYIRKLEEEERRAKELEEALELQRELAAESSALNTGQIAGGAGGWYFYNSTVRNSGKGEFLRVWGKRQLEDDWRRKNKPMSGAMDVAGTESGGDGGGSELSGKEMEAELASEGKRRQADGDPKDINYYLKQIPKTPEEIDSSNIFIQRAFLEVASAYKEELQDYKESALTLETMDARFPDGRYEPKMLYVQYLVYGKLEDTPKQERAKNRLLEKFPNHLFTRKVLDPSFGETDNTQYLQAQLFYQICYEHYKAGKYKECAKCLDKAIEEFKQTELRAKLELMQAILAGKLKSEKEMIEQLKQVQGSFPNTPESAMAASLLTYLGADVEVPAAKEEAFGKYTFDPKDKHSFVIILPNKGVDINQIRNEVSNHNTTNHRLDRLSLKNIFLDQDRQLIVVSGLKDSNAAKAYLKGISANEILSTYLPNRNVEKLIFGEANFQVFFTEKDLEVYKKFFQKHY
jgi:tetratricopeptide (TPR) repeat protein